MDFSLEMAKKKSSLAFFSITTFLTTRNNTRFLVLKRSTYYINVNELDFDLFMVMSDLKMHLFSFFEILYLLKEFLRLSKPEVYVHFVIFPNYSAFSNFD